jgi:hypothetical protein
LRSNKFKYGRRKQFRSRLISAKLLLLSPNFNIKIKKKSIQKFFLKKQKNFYLKKIKSKNKLGFSNKLKSLLQLIILFNKFQNKKVSNGTLKLKKCFQQKKIEPIVPIFSNSLKHLKLFVQWLKKKKKRKVKRKYFRIKKKFNKIIERSLNFLKPSFIKKFLFLVFLKNFTRTKLMEFCKILHVKSFFYLLNAKYCLISLLALKKKNYVVNF